MKMFLISDNVDTRTGMRLAGIEGIVLHEKEEVELAIKDILRKKEIGVLLITEKLGALIPEVISDIKQNYTTPLIVEIPDRHGTSRPSDSITRYIREAIGLKIWGVKNENSRIKIRLIYQWHNVRCNLKAIWDV